MSRADRALLIARLALGGLVSMGHPTRMRGFAGSTSAAATTKPALRRAPFCRELPTLSLSDVGNRVVKSALACQIEVSGVRRLEASRACDWARVGSSGAVWLGLHSQEGGR